jgi:leucine dehydrogenase
MSLFGHRDFDAHEHVSFFADPSAGMRAIVAIHRSGPFGAAGGGCRMWPYRDEAEAVRDVLRLSRAMTYKLALLELPAGGAKAVIIGDPARDKSEALLEALGRAIDRLGGRFIAAEDVGIHGGDLDTIARSTSWVSRPKPGASDTSIATAVGVRVGIRAAVRRRLGARSLAGITVAVQGLGHVGRALCRELAAEGAKLKVTDLDRRAVEEVARELRATPVQPEAIVDEPADVFAPCALSDAIDPSTLPRLRCSIVAGSANNQLADPDLADALAGRDILYAPDFVINAGGVLGAASSGIAEHVLRDRLEVIGALLEGVFSVAERERISTHAAAERLARERFAQLMGLR